MKRFTKFVVALLVLSMMLAIVPAASAAAYEGEPGKTVKVIFEFEDILGINSDTFEISDPDGIVAGGKIAKIETNLGGTYADDVFFYYDASGKTPSDFKLVYELELKDTAEVGAECKVAMTYDVTGSDDKFLPYQKAEHTVVVVAEVEDPTEPTETQPADPTEPTETQPADPTDPTDPADPTVPGAAIDYTALKAAIEAVENFIKGSPLAAKLQELLSALKAARELLNSGDQTAVDAAAALLTELLAELEKEIQDLTKIEEIIKEIEKIVEVEPTDPYCNISIHHVWPILFFISLFVNVGFIVFIVVYFVRRKKNQTDDTPLVNYDIGDDVAE